MVPSMNMADGKSGTSLHSDVHSIEHIALPSSMPAVVLPHIEVDGVSTTTAFGITTYLHYAVSTAANLFQQSPVALL
jgi:hypothetical protein